MSGRREIRLLLVDLDGTLVTQDKVEARLSAITGVVESGLLIGLAAEILVGRSAGVELLQR